MKYFYFVQYIIYSGIASYDYVNDKKMTLLWLSLSLLCLALFIIDSIKDKTK